MESSELIVMVSDALPSPEALRILLSLSSLGYKLRGIQFSEGFDPGVVKFMLEKSICDLNKLGSL
jgi:hypothetical protein